MSIVPITFNDKNVPSAVDGGFYHAHNGDGILLGCGMSITATALTIQSGLIIACGRLISISGATVLDLSEVAPSSGYLQVVLNVSPLSDPPVDFTYNTSGAAVFPALTQQDINSEPAGLYQLELAILQISGGNLANIYSSLRTAPVSVASPSRGTLESFVDAYGGGLRVLDTNGDSLGGISAFWDNPNFSVNIFGNGRSVFIRPNGASDDAGRFCVYPNGDILVNGQEIGGYSPYQGTHSGSSISAGGNVTINKIENLPSGLYVIVAYFRGTPSTTGSNGTTDIFIEVNGSSQVIDEIQGNTNVPRYRTIPLVGVISGTLSLRVWSSSAYGWNNIGSLLRAFRIG